MNLIGSGMVDLACLQAKIAKKSIFDQILALTSTKINKVIALIMRKLYTKFELDRTRQDELSVFTMFDAEFDLC